MKYFLVLTIFLLVFSACSNKKFKTDQIIEDNNQAAEFINLEDGNYIIDVGPNLFSMEEVIKHDKVEDCWVVLGDKIYDVTDHNFGCGIDITEFHHDNNEFDWDDHYIGDLE